MDFFIEREEPMGPLSSIYHIKKGIKNRRVSSYDKTGGNADNVTIPAGETKSITLPGAGIIKHIWITIACDDPMIRRNAVIRAFWDGEERPSVQSPIGDFFGQGFGEKYNYTALPICAAPSGGNALVSYFPMPFANGARLEIENQSEMPIKHFYFYVDYEEYTVPGTDWGRFHAWWNREITKPDNALDIENEWDTLGAEIKNPTGEGNYLFADIEGCGHFAGIQYFVDCPTPMWYGEGDDLFLIDGEPWPGLSGTGTEDFFNMSWCPKEPYMHPYFGFGKVNDREGWMGRTHCYRFFLDDPVYFQKSLRASIEHGHANGLTLDLSSVAYWYQQEPHKPFPALAPLEKRQNMPVIDAAQMHRWRHGWRETKGKGELWGDEK
jgi:hypothetical protein